MFFHRTAQEVSDLRLAKQVTRNKYTPKSVYEALQRRQKLLNQGYGHHPFKQSPAVVAIINAIR